MSETEHHKGKLTELKPVGNETLQDFAKRLLIDNRIKVKEGEDYLERLTDELYKDYILVFNKLYLVEDKKLDADGDIMNASTNADGTIDFEVRYYNGGCGFSEAIGYAIKNMNKINK